MTRGVVRSSKGRGGRGELSVESDVEAGVGVDAVNQLLAEGLVCDGLECWGGGVREVWEFVGDEVW